MLQLAAGQEADFYSLLKGRGDAAQHFQGVAIVVRIFEPGNNGLGRADLGLPQEPITPEIEQEIERGIRTARAAEKRKGRK